MGKVSTNSRSWALAIPRKPSAAGRIILDQHRTPHQQAPHTRTSSAVAPMSACHDQDQKSLSRKIHRSRSHAMDPRQNSVISPSQRRLKLKPTYVRKGRTMLHSKEQRTLKWVMTRRMMSGRKTAVHLIRHAIILQRPVVQRRLLSEIHLHRIIRTMAHMSSLPPISRSPLLSLLSQMQWTWTYIQRRCVPKLMAYESHPTTTHRIHR